MVGDLLALRAQLLTLSNNGREQEEMVTKIRMWMVDNQLETLAVILFVVVGLCLLLLWRERRAANRERNMLAFLYLWRGGMSPERWAYMNAAAAEALTQKFEWMVFDKQASRPEVLECYRLWGNAMSIQDLIPKHALMFRDIIMQGLGTHVPKPEPDKPERVATNRLDAIWNQLPPNPED